MINPEEEDRKDLKIYDLCIRAFSAPTIKSACLWCFIILKQIDDKLLKRIQENYPHFSKAEYHKHFKETLFNMEFTRFVNLRAAILDSEDAYQYFDKIDTGDSEDIYNYNEEGERSIVNEEYFIAQFIGEIMSALIIEEGIEELLGGT